MLVHVDSISVKHFDRTQFINIPSTIKSHENVVIFDKRECCHQDAQYKLGSMLSQ